MGFVRLLIAWALSLAAYSVVIHVWRAPAAADSGFQESLLGLSVLLGVPTFLFALLVGSPTMLLLARIRSRWLVPLLAGITLAVVMFFLTLLLPAEWRGAGHALAMYAGLLGLVWGLLQVVTKRSGKSRA